MVTIVGFLYDATGSYNVPFHVAGIPLLLGAAILFFIPWAQRTADTTNLMSAAHTYAPDETLDIESVAAEPAGSVATTMTTERTMIPIPEIVLAVDSSFVTIDLDDGESYTVPRRIKRRTRESMCSDFSSVSEMITEATDEPPRQGLSYAKLDNESPRQDVPTFAGSHASSLTTSPKSRKIGGVVQAMTPQVYLYESYFNKDFLINFRASY